MMKLNKFNLRWKLKGNVKAKKIKIGENLNIKILYKRLIINY